MGDLGSSTACFLLGLTTTATFTFFYFFFISSSALLCFLRAFLLSLMVGVVDLSGELLVLTSDFLAVFAVYTVLRRVTFSFFFSFCLTSSFFFSCFLGVC